MRRWLVLALVSAAMLALRLVWVARFREIDSDAYGHFFIAIAARRDPTNLAVHWVWLPLFHYVVGGLTALGLGFHGLRIANALLATVGPVLLFDALRRRLSEDEALVAAVAFAIAPLTTILGQSAQPETLFSVLVVAAFGAGLDGRAAVASLALAAACFVRYEAWGASLALAIWWFVAKVRHRPGPATSLALVPAALVAAYVAFRWWSDGHLLLFVRGTRDITKAQVARDAWTLREIVSFPIVLPFIVLGPTLALVPFGLRRALGEARAFVMPVGFAAFLLASYYAGGSHSGERYLVALVPFACAAIGAGAFELGRRAWLGRPVAVAVVALALLGTTTAWHLRRAARMAIAWDDGLREREEQLMRVAAHPDAL